MVAEERSREVRQDPFALLEIALMEEYLGGSLASLKELLPGEARCRLIRASLYASARLTEIQAKARFAQDWKGSSGMQFTE